MKRLINPGRLTSYCTKEYQAGNNGAELSCSLPSSELRQRKTTVLQDLKKQRLERIELENGYAFKFPGTDQILDQLVEFIKTERECCGFFIFGLSISDDKSEIWLELTGPEGTKDLIASELGIKTNEA